jgi:hypothetical protein
MKTSKILRLYALMWLLIAASCDRNEAIETVSGEMIEVRVNIQGILEGQSEEAMRSASLSSLTNKREILIDSQPIGVGMLVDMNLELDKDPLRATPIPLEVGKKFRVIALDRATHRYVSHGDFVITNNGSDNTNDGSLHVLEGVSHDFICISYNSDDDLPTPFYNVGYGISDLRAPANGTDLLYALVPNKTINNSGEASISFLLEHQLSKVTLIIDGSQKNWVPSVSSTGIYVSPCYANAALRLWDGNWTKGSAVTNQYFKDWTTSGYTQTSAPYTVFTNAEAIKLIVRKESISISGVPKPSDDLELFFTNPSSLVAGNSYTLRLRIRTPTFAASNIYWDGNTSSGKLTFALAETTGTNRHGGYQGVFFKWGSLVGVSPAQVSGSFPDGFTYNNSTPAPVYKPTYNATTPTSSSWSYTTSHGYTTAAWGYASNGTADNGTAVIPYVDGSYQDGANLSSTYNTYLMDAARNTTPVYQGLRGDICQYLGKTQTALKDYRLPTIAEFCSIDLGNSNGIDGWTIVGTTGSTDNTLGNAYGTADLTISSRRHASNSLTGSGGNAVVFPYSGERKPGSGQYDGGSLEYVGGVGTYWSGSARANTNAHSMALGSSSVHASYDDRSYAFPVRCVKKVDPNGNY